MENNVKIEESQHQGYIKVSFPEDEGMAKCPMCNQYSLRMEGGCYTCTNDKCGYSKCDL